MSDDFAQRGILYPALHKFYSALLCLEKFEKGNDLFDNISHLDGFFSEYRNVTFVLQKSLAHTTFSDLYEIKRNRYLVNELGKWFVNKRNETTKEHPFELEKQISITIYSSQTSFALPVKIFTIDNDVEYITLVDSLTNLFKSINPVEVFFSIEFSFYEKGCKKDIYEDLMLGINNMKLFFQDMSKDINEDCLLCKELQNRIESMNFERVPKNMLFIDDYVYYVNKNKFEKSKRTELNCPNVEKRPSLDGYCSFLHNNQFQKKNSFIDFVIMHLTYFEIQKKLLPTVMIIFEDNTFDLRSFEGSIKTTFYRKINEIADRIEKDKIKAVYFVCEMYYYSNVDVFCESYTDRVKQKQSELLYFFMINKNFETISYGFDSTQIGDSQYILQILTSKQKTESTKFMFLHPILAEFQRISKLDNGGC